MTTPAQLTLEERTCVGGCGKKFKCLPSSSAVHARSNCAVACHGAKNEEPWIKPTRLPEKITYSATSAAANKCIEPEKPVESTEAHTVEQQSDALRMRAWMLSVEEARACVSSINENRHRIIDLALRNCDIIHGGGGHWSKHAGLYTVSRFAAEIGINYKTLTQWIAVKRNVIDQLPAGEYAEADFQFAQRAHKQVGHNADRPTAIAAFRKLRRGAKTTFKLATIISWTKSHYRFIKKQDLAVHDQVELEALLVCLDDTATIVRRHLEAR